MRVAPLSTSAISGASKTSVHAAARPRGLEDAEIIGDDEDEEVIGCDQLMTALGCCDRNVRIARIPLLFYGLLRILINPASRLPAQPPGLHILHQQRRGTIFLS